jgi:hypothetical protein
MRGQKGKIPASCHPDRPHWARGLCAMCYQRRHKTIHPDKDKIQWRRLKQLPGRSLLKAARQRAQQRNRPCTISVEDIVIPETCPILGIPLTLADGYPTENSPSLDEITVGLGYVPNNIQVISRKANTMKSNATPDELRGFAKWIRTTYGD